MALAEYKKKRQFDSTPEPEGPDIAKARPLAQLRFVVQKHAATRLHYDFRLELGGVLKSWAVPKGPSLNPADKRLAMMVEDHPLEYGSFEGTIPKGNYGAGTVMVWDEGTYIDEPESKSKKEMERRLRAGLVKGDLKFTLSGHKLKGSFVLAKMKSADQDNAWLLIKHKDEHASERDVTKQDRSVLSGRTMDQIAQTSSQWLKEPELDLKGTPGSKHPKQVKPMLATLTKAPFDSPDWIYEVKWDGYRILGHVENGGVRLQSRNNQDYTQIFAPITQELADLKVDCVLDGEIVVVDKDGKPSFGALQNYQKTGKGDLMYYVFDAIYASGHNLKSLPLLERKAIVAQIIAPLNRVRYSDHLEERGIEFYEQAQTQGLEGIIAKRADSAYQEGRRGHDWLKLKTQMRQEAVIGGWTDPRGSRKKIGALVLGLYDDDGKLRYIGHTGGGLDEKNIDLIHEKLAPLEQAKSPFSTSFETNAPVHWAAPKLLCEVNFGEWTADGHMRHPIFVGLREDKDAKTAHKEEASEPPKEAKMPAKSKSKSTVIKGEVKNRHKIFFPEDDITKGDIADYYESIAGVILPHLKARPESLNRHPDGIHGNNFFQKDLENHPDWVKTKPIYSESNDADINWLICNDKDTLLYMVNLGCIELNPWHSRTQKLDHPDFCLIDLDAKSCGFDTVIQVAQETHRLFDQWGIPSYPKTSGKTGMHICIPLGAKYTYEQSRMFAQILVNKIQERLPQITSVERNPDKRKTQLYLDYLQNRKGQTMAAPYSVRPVPGATVSTPLKWSEVKKGLDPRKFTTRTIGKRLDKMGDLWQPVGKESIDLNQILKSLS